MNRSKLQFVILTGFLAAISCSSIDQSLKPEGIDEETVVDAFDSIQNLWNAKKVDQLVVLYEKDWIGDDPNSAETKQRFEIFRNEVGDIGKGRLTSVYPANTGKEDLKSLTLVYRFELKKKRKAEDYGVSTVVVHGDDYRDIESFTVITMTSLGSKNKPNKAVLATSANAAVARL